MESENIFKIRPAGRHLLTIGKDLIQDTYAAVVELVKNAYDANSPDVIISFIADEPATGYRLSIEDKGDGMSRDTVINSWLVPSTDYKLTAKRKDGARIPQGRKGIGRYAASILGKDLFLETVTESGEETTVCLEWKDFEQAKYLDDVPILVETFLDSSKGKGTTLTMKGDNEMLSSWTAEQFRNLHHELKKLTIPKNVYGFDADDEAFQIRLKIKGFPSVDDLDEEVVPFPIVDLYDYRIAGVIREDGKGELEYSQQRVRNAPIEKINFVLLDEESIPVSTGCGVLYFDIRVFDRDPASIDALIARGLKGDSGDYVGKQEARRLLDEYNGIGVYRNGFRIRPMGDPGFDWLQLDKERFMKPALRISCNQAIGCVLVQSEEQSCLIEKSARDGLHQSVAMKGLRWATKAVLNELETRRFRYRQKEGLSRPALKVEKELTRLFSFEELKSNVQKKMSSGGVEEGVVNSVLETIKNEESVKNKALEDIRQAIAIYQGQATLGKIINVILHEGRHPLSYFKNQIPHLHFYRDEYLKTKQEPDIEKCLSLIDGIAQNSEVFVRLFGRLDPLAAGKRSGKKALKLEKTLRGIVSVFESELNSSGISVNVSCPSDFEFICWKQDLYSIFTNLIDNSIYWMTSSDVQSKEVVITAEVAEGQLQYIDYRDTGPGIDAGLIQSGVIFEPQFSTKPNGTGLGLAIAGEAAARNDLELKAFETSSGAYFRLDRKAGEG